MNSVLLDVTPTPINVADTLKTVIPMVMEQIKEDPNTFFETLAQNALHFGVKVLLAFALWIAGTWLIKRVKQLLVALFRKRGTDVAVASFVISFVKISLYVILLLICIGTLGVNTTSFAALFAAGGMAIGMALSGTVQNFAGGIMLMIFKPFKAGDFINAQGFSGTVTAVTIVNTKLRTPDNKIISIPNGILSNGTIENVSDQPLRRVEWEVSVEYGSDADAGIELIKSILLRDSRILNSSTPGAADVMVALKSLNENDISFVARAWVNSADYWDVFFENLKTIYTELPRNGFEFAYPHMDVTINNKN